MTKFLTQTLCVDLVNQSTDDSFTSSLEEQDYNDAIEEIPATSSKNLFIQQLEAVAKSEGELLDAENNSPAFKTGTENVEFIFAQREELFRRDYINRLTMMKVIRPQNEKAHQTIAIFDWDDTLLPTSFLYYVGLDKIENNTQMKAILKKLDKNITKILEKTVKVAKTYIITNAMKHWVETSSEMYLPLTHRFLKNNQVTIISARHEYEEAHPEDQMRWKLEAFLKLQASLAASITTNIICMGDSEIEMEAAEHIGRKFNHAMVKTIKFKQQPRPEELIKQHELVLHKFDQIYTTLKSLSIKLEKKE